MRYPKNKIGIVISAPEVIILNKKSASGELNELIRLI
jgi:hypothetical protein